MKLRQRKRNFFKQFKVSLKEGIVWHYHKYNMPNVGHFWSGINFKSQVFEPFCSVIKRK